MNRIYKLVICFAFSICTSAFAYDFKSADEAFAKREANPQAIHEGIQLYRSSLSQGLASGEKIYAVEQTSRLYLYEGLISMSSNPAHAAEVAMQCYDMLGIISNVDGRTPPAYYYWKAMSLGGWAKAKGVLTSLERSREMLELVEKGIAVDPTYEGGGFYRLGGGIYAELPSINPFGPAGDLRKAIDYADRAYNSPAYAGAAFPDTATGEYFFDIYEVKTDILMKQGQRQKAKDLLTAAISRIDKGDVPPDRIPEAKEQRKNFVKMRASM